MQKMNTKKRRKHKKIKLRVIKLEWKYLTDVTADHEWVGGNDNKSDTPVEDEGNDKRCDDHANILQQNCCPVNDYCSKQCCICLQLR